MRTIAIIFLALLSGLATTTAQDTSFTQKSEMKTVFGTTGKIEHGGYGALTMGYTSIDDRAAMLIGGRGGWLVNHHFTLGLSGYGFFNNIEKYDNLSPSENYSISGGYGGLFLEAIIAPNFPVHVAIPLTIGAGGATLYEGSFWDYESEYSSSYYEYDASPFFVIEPGLELELNIVSFFRLSLGANYRWTNGIDLTYRWVEGIESKGYKVPSDALDGVTYHLTLKFGWF
jgi:hypothetical protein